MFVIQSYDESGKNLGKYAGVDTDGTPEVNRSILCACKYRDKGQAEEIASILNEWGGEDFSFKVTKVKEQ